MPLKGTAKVNIRKRKRTEDTPPRPVKRIRKHSASSSASTSIIQQINAVPVADNVSDEESDFEETQETPNKHGGKGKRPLLKDLPPSIKKPIMKSAMQKINDDDEEREGEDAGIDTGVDTFLSNIISSVLQQDCCFLFKSLKNNIIPYHELFKKVVDIVGPCSYKVKQKINLKLSKSYSNLRNQVKRLNVSAPMDNKYQVFTLHASAELMKKLGITDDEMITKRIEYMNQVYKAEQDDESKLNFYFIILLIQKLLILYSFTWIFYV